MKTFPKPARIFLLLLVCVLAFSALPAAAAGKAPQVIRVAYPIQEGLTMLDEAGTYSGYTYEYLMEISQYTGWRYEFVTLEGDGNDQLLALMDLLRAGEIDLYTGIYYDESLLEDFSYPGQYYGMNYSGIFVPNDSPFTETDLYSGQTIRVGVHNQELNPNQKLAQFADMNRLNIEQVVVSTVNELQQLVNAGEVDAIFSTDVAKNQHVDMHPIARFSPLPFYMVTKKGNVNLVRQLDYALSTIDQVNPNFSMELYNKYFSAYSSAMQITDEEAAFLESCGPLNVVMYNNKPPFQYADPQTGEPSGISVEVLNQIAALTGLSFHYNMVSTYDAYVQALQTGQADISADTLLNYQDAANLQCTLTLPWHALPVYLLFRDDSVRNGSERYAIPNFFRNAIPRPSYVSYYDTVEECMRAVQNGMADYCYVGEFCSQFQLNSGAYDDLRFLNQSDAMTQQLCFGICDTDDHYLLALFNKAITYLPSDDLDEIIYRNTYRQQELPLRLQVKNNLGKIVTVALVVLVLFAAYALFTWSRKQHRISFENERYHMLSNLANEYFYEYDPFRDELNLSEKCAEAFSCVTQFKNFSESLAAIRPEEQCGIWQLGPSLIKNSAEGQEIFCTMPDHSQQWFKIISSFLRDSKQKIYVIGKISDIQQAKQEQLRLEQDATRDGLTHIFNVATARRLIEQRLAVYPASAPCALVILDIDNFKCINDRHGHYTGDAVLTQVATTIMAMFPNDITGRLGGDEFIIFTERMNAAVLETKCRELSNSVPEHAVASLGVPITMSIGAAFCEAGQSYEALYQQADDALYRVKSTTKNSYALYAKPEA